MKNQETTVTHENMELLVLLEILDQKIAKVKMIKVITKEYISPAEGFHIGSFGRYVIRGADHCTYIRCSTYQDALVQLRGMNACHDKNKYPVQLYEVFKVSDPFHDALDMVSDAAELAVDIISGCFVALVVSIVPMFIYFKLTDYLPYGYKWIALVIAIPTLIIFTYFLYRYKRYDYQDSFDRRIFALGSNIILLSLLGLLYRYMYLDS